MKKLFLLLLIMISLPVYAQVPSSMPGTYEQQAAPTLPPLQVLQRKILKGWIKENTNEDGSNRTSFLSDEEIEDVDEGFSSNSQESKDFNNNIIEKPPLQKETPVPEIEKSTTIPDDITNWTEEDAREWLFNNVEYIKDISAFPQNDPDYKINIRAMKAGLDKLGNKYFTLFSDETYEIRIMTDELYNKAFYYSKKGKLEIIVYYNYPKHIFNAESLEKANDDDLVYPCTNYRYTVPDGKLLATGFKKRKVSYIFNIDKSLNCYWIGDTGYTPEGKIFMKAKTIKY